MVLLDFNPETFDDVIATVSASRNAAYEWYSAGNGVLLGKPPELSMPTRFARRTAKIFVRFSKLEPHLASSKRTSSQ